MIRSHSHTVHVSCNIVLVRLVFQGFVLCALPEVEFVPERFVVVEHNMQTRWSQSLE